MHYTAPDIKPSNAVIVSCSSWTCLFVFQPWTTYNKNIMELHINDSNTGLLGATAIADVLEINVS